MEQDLLIERPMDQVVLHYARTARAAGLTAWSALLWRRRPSMRLAARTFSR